jgi:hypothetical protein
MTGQCALGPVIDRACARDRVRRVWGVVDEAWLRASG